MNSITQDRVSVPRHLRCLRLKGKQPNALLYVLSRTSRKPQWRFNPVELASILKISRQGAWKMCKAFVKKNILKDVGNKRIDIPKPLQRNGWSYYKVHEYAANLDLLFPINGLPTNLNSTNIRNNSTSNGNHNSPVSIPPTFYNLTPTERTELLIKWNRKELWIEYFAHDYWEPLPETFYKLTPMEKISQV